MTHPGPSIVPSLGLVIDEFADGNGQPLPERTCVMSVPAGLAVTVTVAPAPVVPSVPGTVTVTSRNHGGPIAVLALPGGGQPGKFRHAWTAADVLTISDDAGTWPPLTVQVRADPVSAPPASTMHVTHFESAAAADRAWAAYAGHVNPAVRRTRAWPRVWPPSRRPMPSSTRSCCSCNGGWTSDRTPTDPNPQPRNPMPLTQANIVQDQVRDAGITKQYTLQGLLSFAQIDRASLVTGLSAAGVTGDTATAAVLALMQQMTPIGTPHPTDGQCAAGTTASARWSRTTRSRASSVTSSTRPAATPPTGRSSPTRTWTCRRRTWSTT